MKFYDKDMDDSVKLQVWNNAKSVDGFDNAKYRKDPCGAWMIYEEYGNQDSIYGWQIDHIYPKSLLQDKFKESEIDNPANLRAMQWENNESKDNNYPNYQSIITSRENENVRESKSLTVNESIQNKLKELYNL